MRTYFHLSSRTGVYKPVAMAVPFGMLWGALYVLYLLAVDGAHALAFALRQAERGWNALRARHGT